MKKAAMGLVALVLFIAVGASHGLASTDTGSSVTYTGTKAGSTPGVTLHASVTFAVSNLDLIITLANTGSYDPSVSADILTSIFFKIDGDPALTPVSAQLGPDASVIGHPLPLGFDGNVGGEWAYQNDLTKAPSGANEGISTVGFKWFKANDLFPGPNLQGPKAPGGVKFGITTINDLYSNDKGGLKSQGLIQAEVIFTLADLPEGFEYTDIATEISDVTFQYGTNLKQPDILGDAIAQIPEPSTISLVAAGLLGALTLARRKMSRR